MLNKVCITETVLRDAHQSLAATRMTIEDMLPICEKLDKVGYWSIECWGGATFDACLRFLNEDPWERLRLLKKALPNTKLQMLLRGQNLLGYRHYADDVVDLFIKKSIENGIDVIRIFDALNDIRNMKKAIESTKKYGAICEAAIVYTISPVHNEDYFVNLATNLESLGADVICIKDMANLLLPQVAYSLVKKIKQRVNVPIHIHTHDTSGTGEMVYLKAVEAGADIIDCAISPLANGTSQPATESMVVSLSNTDFDTGLNLDLLCDVADYFKPISEKLDISKKVLRVDSRTLKTQVPGGMLSNLISQLKEANALDKLDMVLKEVPIVREDFGFPPLVTPTSQIIGTQAVLNVLLGRYSTFSNESKMLLQGKYGKLPGKVNVDVQKKALGNVEAIECRPANLLQDELAELRKKYLINDEKILSLALFPQLEEKIIYNEKVKEISVVF